MDSFSRQGMTFPVIDAGPADGEVVVLLHGFPQQPSAFGPVAGRLNEAGYRTLIPTQRGYAPSCRPRARRDYRTAAVAEDVVALINTAGVQSAHVVGHDWGGAQAWGAAAWYTNRIASVTVLSTPHPAALFESFTKSRQWQKSWYMGVFQLPGLPEVMASRTLRRTLTDSGLPDGQVQAYVRAMLEPDALKGALNWYRGMPFSGSPKPGMITVPATYVWGRRDFALGRWAAERTERYVRGPYEFVELDAGHWLPETHPDEVTAAILRRIKRVAPTT